MFTMTSTWAVSCIPKDVTRLHFWDIEEFQKGIERSGGRFRSPSFKLETLGDCEIEIKRTNETKNKAKNYIEFRISLHSAIKGVLLSGKVEIVETCDTVKSKQEGKLFGHKTEGHSKVFSVGKDDTENIFPVSNWFVVKLPYDPYERKPCEVPPFFAKVIFNVFSYMLRPRLYLLS